MLHFSILASTKLPTQQATGIGNGFCEPELNNSDCLYDGGDCCSCTCETAWDDDWGCVAIDCKDPSAPCVGEDSNM